MDKPKENIRFLDNFDFNLSLANRAEGGRQFTDIDIGVQPLILRVSFRDILLIKNIVNRAIEMSNRAPVEVEEPPARLSRPPTTRKPSRTVSGGKTVSGGRRRSSAAQIQAQLIISKETVSQQSEGSEYMLIIGSSVTCYY